MLLIPLKFLGRGRGIRTPKGGFGDRWFTVSLCPYGMVGHYDPTTYLISLCGLWVRQAGQNLLISSRSVLVFLFFVLL